MQATLQPTMRIEMELPGNLAAKAPQQLQRTLIRYLYYYPIVAPDWFGRESVLAP